MGSFDCFCAICGSCLRSPQIGSTNPRALARRDRRVNKKRSRMESQGDAQKGDENLVSDSESENEDMEEEEEEEEEDDDDDDWYPEDEDRSYDPRVVSDQTTQWLSDVRCLGFNPNAIGVNRAFITGAASYSDHGAIEAALGNDPNQPEEAEFDCYEACEQSRMAVFPFHDACYKILARAISSSDKTDQINKDVMYDVMSRLTQRYRSYLNVDYGNISGIDQFWEAIPGEEFSVFNPLHVDDFGELLSKKMRLESFQVHEKTPISGVLNQENDIFSKLTPHILLTILKYLPGDDILALSSVSRSVYHATSRNDFWKQLLLDAMPWLWDQSDTVNEKSIAQLDCKKLYVWTTSATCPKNGIEPPFLAIANRRRIWNTCVQISNLYYILERRRTLSQPEQVVVQTSHCPYMVRASHLNSLNEVSVEKSYWIYSPRETCDSSAVVETFWSSTGALTGISLVIGSSQRILGRGSTELGQSKAAVRIGAGEWISAINLHLSSLDGPENQRLIFIEGISIVLLSGSKYELGNTKTSYGIRPLVASAGHYLSGLQAQLTSDGDIVQLGILQVPKDANQNSEPEVADQNIGQRLLWGPSYLVPTRGASFSDSAPAWSHPSLEILPVFPLPFLKPEDNIHPYHVLLWGKDTEELTKISRISILTGSSGLLGFRAEFVKRYWEPKRCVGKRIEEWPEDQTIHFDVDAASGEVITDIGVPKSKLTGIMLGTNRERREVFGTLENQEWVVEKAPVGRCIIGIAASFLPTSEAEVNGTLDSLIILHIPAPTN